jgi:hypothetical protein
MHFSDGPFFNLPPFSVLPLLILFEELVEFPEKVGVNVSEESLDNLYCLGVDA